MKIGRHSYVSFDDLDIRFQELGEVTIGHFCSIAENCVIFLSGEHNTENISTFPFDLRLGWKITNRTSFSNGDVTIGNDVWIGAGVVILSGVTIGDGVVIGAYSVVGKNIPPYEIWGGSPIIRLKKRFNDFEIRWLLNMKWWDWPDDLIQEASPLLTSGDIEGLIKFWKERVVTNA